MKCIWRFILFSVLLVGPSLAEASTEWPNEPAGFSAIYDCHFSNTICGMYNNYNTQAYIDLPQSNGGPLSPTRAFNVEMAIGSTYGNGEWGLGLGGAKEVFLGTWWSTNPQFVGNNAANKMFFLRNPSVDNNYMHWYGSPSSPKALRWSMQATYDNTGPGEAPCFSCGDGSGIFAQNVNSSFIAAGSGWHRLELYIKCSSTKTSRDGILRWWVDGVLIGNYPSVNMSPGGLQEFNLTPTWDGFNTANRDQSVPWNHYYDHIRISTGSGGGGGVVVPPPDTTPPSTVTGLTVTKLVQQEQ